jgi:hypothetical protein
VKNLSMFRHISRQPFIVATGMAALIHSTWALGTLFSGQQPEGWHLLGWLAPALLIAFALDVGQIATSGEIREHGLTLGRGLTFFVFAAATYYLQWLYIAHHMPALAIAAGVSDTARSTAVYMRDAAVWIIPAFLPLSTVLYTFSGKTNADSQSQTLSAPPVEVTPVVEAPRPVEIASIEAPAGEAALPAPPFGNTAPELAAPENSELTESMPMIESAGERPNGAKKRSRTKTPQIQEK